MPLTNICHDILEALELPLFVVNTERIIVFANRAVISFAQRLGYAEQDTVTVGRNLFEALPKLPPLLALRYDELFVTGKPQEDEREFRLNESVSWIRSQRFPVFSNGQVSHVVTILLDETEFRVSQEALKQSEATARAIINASSESILLADPDGTIVTANEIAASRLGRPLKEIIGRTGGDLLPPDVWRKRAPIFGEVLRTGKQASQRDVRDGAVFDTTMYPVLDEAGQVRQVAVFATDVTQQVAIQEELLRIRRAVESSSDAIGMTDMEGRHVFSNKAFEDLLGYSVEQLEAVGGPRALYKDRALAAEIFDKLIGGTPWSGVVAMVTRSGKDLMVDLRADAIRDEEGRLIGLIVILTDVTSQQRASDELKRSEERFRLQFQSIPIPTFIWERTEDDFFLRDFNRAAMEMTRGGIVNFVGRRASEMYADRPGIVADLAACHSSGRMVVKEMTYQYHSVRDERYLHVFYVPIPPDLILVHTVDLTERKRIETELQYAQSELEAKVAARTEALRKQVEFDVLVRRMLTNFAGCRETEIDAEIRRGLKELAEFTGAESAYTILVSPDQQTYRVAHVWVAEGRANYASLYQNIAFGAYRWLEQRLLAAEEIVIGTLEEMPNDAVNERRAFEQEGVRSALIVPLRGSGGRISGAVGLRAYEKAVPWNDEQIRWLRTAGDAIANVLERKLVEEAKRLEQDRAELYLQTAEVILVALGRDGTITRINRKGCQILGYEEQELVGRNWFDLCVPTDERDGVKLVAKELYEGARFTNFENNVLTKSGDLRRIAWRNSLLRDKSGEVIGSLSSGEDITERKIAEGKLDEAYERLQVEQEALTQKNIALQEMVEQVQESRRATAAQIQSNLDRVVLPILERVGTRLDPQGQEYLALARSNLSDVLSPFVSELESRFKRLSPREVEICGLIRRGYDTKQIADLRNSSVQTVLKQRKAIRKKLGLDRKKVNLATYLASTFPGQRKREK